VGNDFRGEATTRLIFLANLSVRADAYCNFASIHLVALHGRIKFGSWTKEGPGKISYVWDEE